jgi:hypothetical protein
MAKKKMTPVMPVWFVLRKYELAGKLDISGWHWNIMWRMRLRQQRSHEMPADWHFIKSPELVAQVERFFRACLARHLEQPVITRPVEKSGEIDHSRVVRDMSVADALYHAESIFEE